MKNQFKHIEAIIKGIVPKRSTLPILETVALDGNSLRVTDLEITAVVPFASGVNICVQSKDFLAAIKRETPTFEQLPENKIRINGGTVVTGESTEEYPGMGEKPSKRYINLTASQTESMKRIAAYCTKDELRPAMMGLYIDKDHFVATDGHRLTFEEHGLDVPAVLIVPVKAINLIASLKRDWKVYSKTDKRTLDVSIWNDEEQRLHDERRRHFWELKLNGMRQRSSQKEEERYNRLFELADDVARMSKKVTQNFTTSLRFVSTDGIEITTRTIEEQYPNWKAVLPDRKDVSHKVTANKEALMETIKEALTCANKTAKQVKLNLNGSLTVRSQDIDFGKEFTKSIDCTHEQGGTVDVGFNGSYLLSLDAMLKGEEVTIELISPNKAVYFNTSTIVMPQRLTD